MKKWLYDSVVKYCGGDLQEVRNDAANKLGVIFFFVAILIAACLFIAQDASDFKIKAKVFK